MTYVDITVNLPAGRLLTRELLDALHQAFEDNGRKPLTDEQVEAVLGSPQVQSRIGSGVVSG